MWMRRIAIVLGLFALASTAMGGALDRKMVADDAKWVLHLDVSMLLSSRMGKAILDRMDDAGADRDIDEFAAFAGFDPREDLDAVTLWGSTYRPDGGVGIFHGTFDRDKLVKLVSQNDDYARSRHRGTTIHSWKQDPEGKRDDGVRYGAIPDAGTVVIARNQAMVKVALDVLSGKADSLAAESALLPAARKGMFVHIAALDLPNLARVAEDAAWAKMVRTASMSLGQADGKVFARARMDAGESETAKRLRQTAQGMLSLAHLAIRSAQEDEPMAALIVPLLDRVEIGGEGLSVTAEIEIKAGTLVEILGKLAENRRRRRD